VLALTYAAAVTTKIRLGVSVIVLPMQHPIHVAHQIATLDYLSNGRMKNWGKNWKNWGQRTFLRSTQVDARERRLSTFQEHLAKCG